MSVPPMKAKSPNQIVGNKFRNVMSKRHRPVESEQKDNDHGREYTLEAAGQFREAISQALSSVVATMSVQPVKVMSLNQIVSNQYRNVPSKRQRPVESEEILGDDDGNFAADDFYLASDSSSRRIQQGDSVDADVDESQSKEKDSITASKDGETKAGTSSTLVSTSGRKKPRSRPSSSNADGNHSTSSSGERKDVESDIVDAIMSKSRPASSEFLVPRPTTRLSDMAGIDSITSQVKELVFYPVLYPDLYSYLGVQPPCGLLLHGPSGCGKTALAYAIAGELGLPFFKASGPELIGGTSGESEERIRDIFLAAAAKAPSVLFIDALDVIAGKKDSAQRGMDRRIVAQLFDSIDSIISLGEENLKLKDDDKISSSASNKENDDLHADLNGSKDGMETQSIRTKKGLVVLIAATNKADALDAGVRGRFSRELSLPVPDAPSRTKILALMTARMKLALDVDLTELGRVTPGFVGADLKALAREAGMLAVSRIVGTSPDMHTQTENISNIGSIVLINRVGVEKEAAVTCAIVVETKAVQSIEGVGSSEVTEIDIKGDIITSGSMSVADDDCVSYSIDTTSSKAQIEVSVSADDCVHDSISPVEAISVDRSLTASVEMRDFLTAAKSVQPSAKREGFAVVPDVTWGDVGALSEVRDELLYNVLEPIAHPERFRSLGLEVPAGVLFFGPPGCGKTLLAKALANQSGANFISVKGPELLNMYVGESESRVRQVFSRARASAPCVIFFDELDALCPRRGSGAEGGSGVSERVVNQLLTELDGLETRKDVYIIAATNRLELIDDAMLRPGRLGKLLYVPLPTAPDRISILAALIRKVSVDKNGLDIAAIGGDPRTDGFSGADLAALVREAGLAVVREMMSKSRDIGLRNGSHGGITAASIGGMSTEVPSSSTALGSAESSTSGSDSSSSSSSSSSSHAGTETAPEDNGSSTTGACICARHFEAALNRVRPSVTLQDRQRYERVQENIKNGMGAIQALAAAAAFKVNTRIGL